MNKLAPNKKIKSLTSFAGTHTRGLLRIIAHVLLPLSGVLCASLYMNLKCCFKIKKWKCSGSVSLLDLFGLTILLSFYLLAISTISFIIGSIFLLYFLVCI